MRGRSDRERGSRGQNQVLCPGRICVELEGVNSVGEEGRGANQIKMGLRVFRYYRLWRPPPII